MHIQTILFPVDASVYPLKALDSIKLFHGFNRELEVIIVHVVEPVSNLIGRPQRDDLNLQLTAAGRELAEPFKDALEKEGIRTSLMIRHGDPASQILAAALEERCDLIVMSPRGEGESGFKELLLGSVSQKVLQHSRVPVLLSR